MAGQLTKQQVNATNPSSGLSFSLSDEKTMGHITFWLRPWLSLLAEPKTTLSQR